MPTAKIPCFLLVALLVGAVPSGCSSGSDARPGAPSSGTNRARFTYAIDLQGQPATMVMEVEAIAASGLTWGPGVRPEITGVIASGSYTVFTSGELRSSVARYIFTGENQFADFTEATTFERFRVRWMDTASGLLMTVNPFGPGPVTYACQLISAEGL